MQILHSYPWGIPQAFLSCVAQQPASEYFLVWKDSDIFWGRRGIPAGFNTAVLAEISRRIGKNIELVSIESGARSIALSEGKVDAVFWSRISKPDQSIFDSLPENRKVDASMIALALLPYRYPDIDIPDGTVTTDVYFHDIYVTLYMKK